MGTGAKDHMPTKQGLWQEVLHVQGTRSFDYVWRMVKGPIISTHELLLELYDT